MGRAEGNEVFKSTTELPGLLGITPVIEAKDKNNELCHNNRLEVSKVHPEKSYRRL